MSLLAALAAGLVFGGVADTTPVVPPADLPLNIKPPTPRFELGGPLLGIPQVRLDVVADGFGLAQQTARANHVQARIMWIDATANIDRYNTEPKIVELVSKIKQVGFNTIVLDVKPISGQVIYPSRLAPKLTEWKGRQLPADFDPVKIFAREARLNKLSLCVSLNAFSEGHQLMKTGPAYAGEKQNWQTVLYETHYSVQGAGGETLALNPNFNKPPTDEQTVTAFNDLSKLPPASEVLFAVAINRSGVVTDIQPGGQLGQIKLPSLGSILVGSGPAGEFLKRNAAVGSKITFNTFADFVPAAERPDQQIPLMVNPLNPAVQDYARGIVKEVLTNYDIDGIVYDDRLRFGGINADFSPIAQQKFEEYLHRRVAWPEDVFRFTLTPGLNRGMVPGPYYDAWMTWRAQVIRNFVLSVRQTAKATKPKSLFGVYAGSWYGDYPRFGQNWASPDAEAGFWFMTPEYMQTGIAPQLDFLITGCYYPTATIADAMAQAIGIGNTVEAAGQMTNRLVRDQTWSYAGLSIDQFKGNPEGLKNAMQAACAATQGVMLFDLSHDPDNIWQICADAFRDPLQAPHQKDGLLQEVRQKRAAVDKLGKKDPPITIHSGSAGVGM